jgi:transcription factor E2F2
VKLLWHIECNLRQLSEDKRYAYITYQDLRGIPEYRHQTVMAIKAPPEAKLQVPHPSQVSMEWVLKYFNMSEIT